MQNVNSILFFDWWYVFWVLSWWARKTVSFILFSCTFLNPFSTLYLLFSDEACPVNESFIRLLFVVNAKLWKKSGYARMSKHPIKVEVLIPKMYLEANMDLAYSLAVQIARAKWKLLRQNCNIVNQKFLR